MAEVEAEHSKALIAIEAGNWEEAQLHAQKARDLFIGGDNAPSSLLASIENRLGFVFLSSERFEEAQSHFRRALSILKSVPDAEQVKGKILFNLATCQRRLGHASDSVSLYASALDVLPSDSPLRWDVLMNLVDSYRRVGDDIGANRFLKLLREEAQRRLNESDRHDRGRAHLYIANVAVDRNDLAEAQTEASAAASDLLDDSDIYVRSTIARITAEISFLQNGDYPEAKKYIMGFVDATRKTYGERSHQHVVAITECAKFFEHHREDRFAQTCYLLASSFALDRVGGANQGEFLDALTVVGEFYARRKESTLEKRVRDLHDFLENSSKELAAWGQSQEGFSKEEIFRLFSEAALRTDEGRRALTRFLFAPFLVSRGLYDEATIHFEAVIGYAEANNAPEFSLLLSNDLLPTLITEGNIAEAAKIATKAVEKIDKTYGPSSARLEGFVGNLIVIEEKRNAPQAALIWADRFVLICEKEYGENSPEHLTALFHRADLAVVCKVLGSVEQLNAVCNRIRNEIESATAPSTLQKFHEVVVGAFVDLGVLGETVAAANLCELYLQKIEQAFPPAENPGMAESLLELRVTLAAQLAQFGAFERAEEIFDMGYGAASAMPLANTVYLESLWNLGTIIRFERLIQGAEGTPERLEMIRKAQELLELRVQRFQSSTVPKPEDSYNTTLRRREESDLALWGARLDFEQGRFDDAITKLADVQVIDQNRWQYSVIAAQTKLAQGGIDAAINILQAANVDQPWEQLRLAFIRTESPRDYFRVILLLCDALRRSGDQDATQKWVENAETVYSDFIRELRLQWPPEVLLSATYFRELIGIAAASGQPKLISDILLRHKGEATETAHMNQGATVKSLRFELGRTLQDRASKGNGEASEQRSADLEISKLQRAIEGELTRNTVSPLPVDLGSVEQIIGPKRVFVDFVQFRAVSSDGRLEDRYGALITRVGADPIWHVLADENGPISSQNLDSLVKEVRRNIEFPPVGDSEQYLLNTLTRLYDLVWAPIAKEVNAVSPTEIIVAPDGALAELPFAALCHPDGAKLHFLCEEPYLVRFVGSMREMRGEFHRPSTEKIFVAGAPLLDQAGTSSSFQLAEVKMLQKETPQLGFKLLEPLIGSQASEEAVTTELQQNESTILHFATHGYGRDIQRSALNDFPGYGGLLFLPSAGYNYSLVRDGDSLTPYDGHLGWREIACLDLDKAWLAVLSSCSSGLGARRPGEGILGMRWGFLQAGVRSQLLSLWDIADSQETVDFMRSFYEALADTSQDARVIPWRLQGKLLPAAARYSFYDAVRWYGGFILYSPGS